MTFISIVETFAAAVVAIITAFGGWEGIKYLKRTFFPSKNDKRQDTAEADKSEVEVKQQLQALQDSINETWQKNIKDFTEIDSARIRELRESNEILNNRITDLLKAGARKDDIISDKTQKIRQLEEKQVEIIREYEQKITDITRDYEQQITDLTKRNGDLEKFVMFYRAWHCEREYGNKKEDCKRRKPAQNPPLRYCPIDERVILNTRVSSCDDTADVPEMIPEDMDKKETKPRKKQKTAS